MPRLLITGSRDWTNRDQMFSILENAFNNHLDRDTATVLVHGDARGADRMAADVWENQGMTTEAHPANWTLLGKRAGIVRNAEMVALGADLCIGFLRPESIGTKHCLKIAKEAGIPVLSYMEES